MEHFAIEHEVQINDNIILEVGDIIEIIHDSNLDQGLEDDFDNFYSEDFEDDLDDFYSEDDTYDYYDEDEAYEYKYFNFDGSEYLFKDKDTYKYIDFEDNFENDFENEYYDDDFNEYGLYERTLAQKRKASVKIKKAHARGKTVGGKIKRKGISASGKKDRRSSGVYKKKMKGKDKARLKRTKRKRAISKRKVSDYADKKLGRK